MTHLHGCYRRRRWSSRPIRCDWCGEWIGPGETYVSEAYMWEGDFQHVVVHPECRLVPRIGDYGEWVYCGSGHRPEFPVSGSSIRPGIHDDIEDLVRRVREVVEALGLGRGPEGIAEALRLLEAEEKSDGGPEIRFKKDERRA